VHDLAVLAVAPGTAPVAPIGIATAGSHGIVATARDGAPATVPVVVRRLVTLQTEDIYLDGVHDRDAFELDADIEPGDSGAAVLVDGRVVGIVFARDRQAAHTAYGLVPTPILDQLHAADAVPTGACARVG
jgi:S1-C subfamily serine protease